MTISFTDQADATRLEEGQIQTLHLQGSTRLRVSSGLVWLTVEGCRTDFWLSPGRDFEYHGKARVVVEAVHGPAQLLVSPLRSGPGWLRWSGHAPQTGGSASTPAPTRFVCSDDTLRISKLLPHGLIRWF